MPGEQLPERIYRECGGVIVIKIYFYQEFGVFLPYKINDNEEEWQAIERVKRLYQKKLKELVRECLYELAEMEFQCDRDKDSEGSEMRNIFFSSEYGVFLTSNTEDGWGGVNAENEYKGRLKSLIKRCIYENRVEDADAYKRAMETLDKWRENK